MPLEWSVVDKHQMNAKTTKDPFQIKPRNGILAPNKKQLIEVQFIPPAEKEFTDKLSFKIKDNPNQKSIDVKGSGQQIKVLFENLEEGIKIDPVLP